jgi:hypothetical protein
MVMLDEHDRGRVAILQKDGSLVPDAFDTTYFPYLANAGTTTAVIWNGNQSSVAFLLNDQPVTIVGRQATSTANLRGSVVPYRMVMALWQPSLEGLRDFLRGHGDSGSVIVLGTPPPKTEDDVRAGIAIEPYFVGLLADQGLTPETAPVTNATSRVAAWEALQDAMAEVAHSAGAHFLAVDPQTQTPEGTLLSEYSGPDATHANPAYGGVMWRRLIDHIDSGR